MLDEKPFVPAIIFAYCRIIFMVAALLLVAAMVEERGVM